MDLYYLYKSPPNPKFSTLHRQILLLYEIYLNMDMQVKKRK